MPSDAVNAPRVVVMGVSGCGKSTVGRALAQRLGVHYIEGDDLHPSGNVERMRAGIPLTDTDRHGWLQEVAGQLANATAQSLGVVVSCSALKRAYRELLRGGAPDVRFVYLQGDATLLAQRMAARSGHYMPPSLLQSQLDTLEPPQTDEHAITIDVAWPTERQVAEVMVQLGSSS
jgi:carbohydrate kinase (thermoresistant glucokinase family)